MAKIICAIALLLLIFDDATALDRRSYQHGIKFFQDSNRNYWLIWSSSPGNPPKGQKKITRSDGSKCSYFTHDIYFSPLNVDHPVLQPQVLISLPEAQEPVDAVISNDGSVAITYEDGSESDIAHCHGVIKQRYKVYSRFPRQSTPIKTVTIDGAHSGHIAAVGDSFVLVYAEGWIAGGGVGDAGTANDIYVDVFKSNAQLSHHKPIAVDKGQPRDWWPLIAGSQRYALLAWQRLPGENNVAQLVFTLYDPVNNRLVSPVSVLKNKLQHYHFDVQYLSAANQFLIVGNYLDSVTVKNKINVVTPKFFAFLLDESGKIIDYWENKTACQSCGNYIGINLVREAKPAIINDKNRVSLIYPVKPDAVIILDVEKQKLAFKGVYRVNHRWFPMGTDGLHVKNNSVLFANLTPSGVRLIRFSVNEEGN